MNKFTEKLKEIFVGRNIAFYIACAVAVVAFIGGTIATVALNMAGVSVLPMLVTLFALIAFVALSFFGLEHIGIAVIAVASFAALVDSICEGFKFFLKEISGQAMGGFNIAAIPGIGALVATLILLVLSAVAANVLAWLKVKEKFKPVAELTENGSADAE